MQVYSHPEILHSLRSHIFTSGIFRNRLLPNIFTFQCCLYRQTDRERENMCVTKGVKQSGTIDRKRHCRKPSLAAALSMFIRISSEPEEKLQPF